MCVCVCVLGVDDSRKDPEGRRPWLMRGTGDTRACLIWITPLSVFCFMASHNSVYNLESHLVLFLPFVFTMPFKDWVERELLADGARKIPLHRRKLMCVLGISRSCSVTGPP